MNQQRLTSVICVATEERADNYKFFPEYNDFNPNLSIIGLPELKALGEEGYKFPRKLDVGMILMENPFEPNTYIDIKTSEQEIFARKMDALTQVARYLGAKSFKCNAQMVERRRREFDGELGGTYKAFKTDIKVTNERDEKYSQEYKRDETMSGETSPEDYQKALEFVEKKCLNEYREIKHILQQRCPDSPNKQTLFHESIVISNEINEATEVAFSMDAMQGLLGIDANTRYAIQHEITVKLDFTLTF